MTELVFRVHPAIGIARVGNSNEYYLGPETMAGLPTGEPGPTLGGLPIRPGTESETIKSSELRDRFGALKRQAARFRIYAYSKSAARQYPSGEGSEITLGSMVGNKTVRDIVWTVHVANKKANCYFLNDELGIEAYMPANADTLKLRNATIGSDPNNAARLKKLVIDPGPRAIRGSDKRRIAFDKATVACFGNEGGDIESLKNYPKTFPDDSFSGMYTPVGPIETLGDLETDDKGRLLVLAASGKACGWLQADGQPYPLIGGLIAPGIYGDVNADGWFDDTADGPVSANLVFDDGSIQSVHGAWVVATDPSYAPQTLNVVSLWDDMFDTWVRKLGLLPDLFASRFNRDYLPNFENDLFPIFRAVSLQRWTTNLPKRAIEAHDAVGRIGAGDVPNNTIMTGLAYVRDPNNEAQHLSGAPFMPLSMGDAGKAFLTVSKTQYFFLQQWDAGKSVAAPPTPLSPGERLDKAVLVNSLGGRFAPGIEMTFIVRDPALYQADWRHSGAGPFRIRGRQMDYRDVQASHPFLTVGYIPLHPGPEGVISAPLEPGDVSKFMAVPWHTDYNSCATHNQAPNPHLSSTLYWSWPAQRPTAVHLAADVHDGSLGSQRYSVRGAGTFNEDLGEQGRWQQLIDAVLHWHEIGFVIQGSAIDGAKSFSAEYFLEVESQLYDPVIEPWPMNSTAVGT